jgi:hypothetical protein
LRPVGVDAAPIIDTGRSAWSNIGAMMPIHLDTLDLSSLYKQAAALLERLETYHRYASARALQASPGTAVRWLPCHRAALDVVAELQRLGLELNSRNPLVVQGGEMALHAAVMDLREWLLVTGWTSPPCRETTQMPDVSRQLEWLRLIVADLAGRPGSPLPKTRQRRCYQRDHTFLKWHDDGLKPAEIRQRWNREHPHQQVSRESVVTGLKTARKERVESTQRNN